MQFNGIQMTAIIKAATQMIAADGKFEDVETRALSFELVNFGVQPEKLQEMLPLSQAMDAATMIMVLSAMNDDQKRYVSGFLATIMVCDGNIDDSELKLWKLIGTLTECPTMTLHEALEYWKNH